MTPKTRIHCGTGQASDILGLSTGTIQALLDSGELAGWKTSGGHRRISVASIKEYQHQKLAYELDASKTKIVIYDENGCIPKNIQINENSNKNNYEIIYKNTTLTTVLTVLALKPQILIIAGHIEDLHQELLNEFLDNKLLSSMITVYTSSKDDENTNEKRNLGITAILDYSMFENWLNGFLIGFETQREIKY